MSNPHKSEILIQKVLDLYIKLGPLADVWLAFLVCVGGVAISFIDFAITGSFRSYLKSNYHSWLIQIVLFSIAAGFGTMLINATCGIHIIQRKINLFVVTAISLIHYFVIAYFASLFIYLPDLLKNTLEVFEFQQLFATYKMYMSVATGEYAVYGAIFFATYAMGIRRSANFPIRASVRQVLFATFAISATISALVFLNPNAQDYIEAEFGQELARIGDLTLIDDILVESNRIKFYEKKYGLEVTGKVSSKLITILKREDTKVEYIVGESGSDSESIKAVCDKLNQVRHFDSSETSDNNKAINIKIRIRSGYVPKESDSCSITARFPLHISIVPVNNKIIDSSTHAIDLGKFSLYLSAKEKSTITIENFVFHADGRHDAIFLEGNIEFQSNSLVLPKGRSQWGIVADGSNGEYVTNILRNRLINAPILVTGSAHAKISENAFIGSVYVDTSENGVADSNDNTDSATDTREVEH